MNDKELKLHFGLRVKQLRTRLGLTQDELAEKISRTQRQISLIEVGKSFPNTETIVNMACVFDCNFKDLFDFETVQNIKNLKKELLNLIDKLPEEKLKTLYLIGKNI